MGARHNSTGSTAAHATTDTTRNGVCIVLSVHSIEGTEMACGMVCTIGIADAATAVAVQADHLGICAFVGAAKTALAMPEERIL